MDHTVISPGWVWCAEAGLRRSHSVIVAGNRVLDVVAGVPGLDARRIDAPGALLIPGLINLHSHTLSAPLFRGLADDIHPGDLPGHIVFSLLMPLGDVAARVMSPDAIGDAAEMALIAALRGGTTTVVDIFRPAQAPFIERARALGLRSYSCPYLFSNPGLGMTADGRPVYGADHAAGTGFEETLALFDRYDEGSRGRTRVGFGPHGPDSCAPALLRMVDAKARELDTLLSIHCAQNLHEVALIGQRHGTTPTAHLRALGLVRPGVVLAHCMYATDEELGIARDGGAAIATCPLAFARSGRFVPVARFEASGVRFGIGTDGVTLDMIDELRTAAIFAKTQSGMPHAGSAARVLRAATRDAALALGRDDLGRITPGATADLLLFDLSGPRYQPVWDPLKALVTNGSAGDIGMVMVDGRILLADGTITTADEAAVTRRGAAAIAGAWQQAEALGAIPPTIRARAAH